MSEEKLRFDARRAQEAKTIVESDAFKEAMRLLERELHDAWAQSEHHETRKRETMFLALRILGSIRDKFGKVIADGSMAKAIIADLEKMGQKAA